MIVRKLALTAAITISLAFAAQISADGNTTHSHDDDETTTESSPGDVAATVNGTVISAMLVDRVSQQLAAQGQQPNREQIIDELINLAVLTQEAEKIELEKDNEIAIAINLQYTQTMANAYLANFSEGVEISDEEIRAEYDVQVAALKASEYNASHILLETEEDAKRVIAELQAGGDFAELAKANSTGPTGETGGDLGWFQAESMVPSFSEAVSTMEVGNTTAEPVQTKFGWHVIQLNETRAAAKPEFSDELKAKIKNSLLRDIMADHVLTIRKTAIIE